MVLHRPVETAPFAATSDDIAQDPVFHAAHFNLVRARPSPCVHNSRAARTANLIRISNGKGWLQMSPRFLIAAGWGILIGALTFAAGPLGWSSHQAAIAAVQMLLTCMIVPGLLVAALVGSLGPAAVVNALIHFGVCFF